MPVGSIPSWSSTTNSLGQDEIPRSGDGDGLGRSIARRTSSRSMSRFRWDGDHPARVEAADVGAAMPT
jgi:hypothetical protein